MSWSKIADLCQNADEPRPIINFPKQKNLLRTEQRYVSRTAIKLKYDRHSSYPLHCELSH